VTASCELPVTGKQKVRLGFKQGESLSNSNSVSLQAKPSGEALASK
jgi:hypothetical protein